MAGSVRKRGTKWYYSFEAAMIGGERKRIEKVGGRTKKEAEAALRIALTEYENSGLHFEPSQISFADYLDYWFEQYVVINCRHNTQMAYQSIIKNHIKPEIGGYKLRSLTSAIIQQFINEKHAMGLSKSFLVSTLAIFSKSLDYALTICKFINQDPSERVKIPRIQAKKKELPGKLEPEEFDKIIELFPFGNRMYIAFMIAFMTGFRQGEVLALTWENIDLDKKTISVEHTMILKNTKYALGPPKTRTSLRTIPIGDTLIKILQKHKVWQSENKLFYGEHYHRYILDTDGTIKDKTNKIKTPELHFICTEENGTFVTRSMVNNASLRINKKLDFDKTFKFHLFRHTHATMMLENGAHIKDIQMRLGHARIDETMNIYAHVTDKLSQQSITIFESCLHEISTVGKA